MRPEGGKLSAIKIKLLHREVQSNFAQDAKFRMAILVMNSM